MSLREGEEEPFTGFQLSQTSEEGETTPLDATIPNNRLGFLLGTTGVRILQ